MLSGDTLSFAVFLIQVRKSLGGPVNPWLSLRKPREPLADLRRDGVGAHRTGAPCPGRMVGKRGEASRNGERREKSVQEPFNRCCFQLPQ